jgi:hypothetical protein
MGGSPVWYRPTSDREEPPKSGGGRQSDRRFSLYRIRVLLYAGKPNWDLLPTITPHSDLKTHLSWMSDTRASG